ncbi:MAG: hypothetical protein LBQ31_06660 [Bacteroidales bacterium]|nr:hypothetical protein [Bacteroidales bacterium]
MLNNIAKVGDERLNFIEKVVLWIGGTIGQKNQTGEYIKLVWNKAEEKITRVLKNESAVTSKAKSRGIRM